MNNEKTFKFLARYIIKCIENNVSYNMKNILDDNLTRERTILLANKDNLYTKLSILDEIGCESEDIIDSFDKPIISSATYDNKYYGISVYKVGELEYNDFFDNVAEVAYYRLLAKLEVNKVHNEDSLKLLNSFLALDKVEGNNPLEAIYDGNSFNDIKDVINRYIVEISKTLDMYMESRDKVQILVKEFGKSMGYIASICMNNKKSNKINIALSDKEFD